MWKNASQKEKQPVIAKELILWAKYNEDIKKWRKERDEQTFKEHSQRVEMVQRAIESGTSDQLIQAAEVYQSPRTAMYVYIYLITL